MIEKFLFLKYSRANLYVLINFAKLIANCKMFTENDQLLHKAIPQYI